jgi:RHS repeat-associated protein
VNWTSEQVKDAAGAIRVLYHDVLGRQIAVVEDPGVSKYATYYTYDMLDNLTDVRQAGTCTNLDPVGTPCMGGLARHFDYTSLKLLVTATNPESGTAQYQYDNAGNVTRKQQGAVVTCYGTRNADNTCQQDGYDDLNRLKKKTYSDATPQVDYAYDAADANNRPADCAAFDGPIGRLASVKNATSINYYFYNKLGYPQCNRQTTSGTPYDLSYTTTPQGEWRQIVYPSKRSVTMNFNDRGMPSSVGNYANSVTYWPHGGLRQLSLVNGVVENTEYNTRLQASSMKAVVGTTSLWKLENFYCPSENGVCESNNGNVISQKLSVPQTAGGTLVLATGYGYDRVNRLTAATEKSGSLNGTPTWGQSYVYTDGSGNNGQYGNLRVTGDEVVPAALACGTYDPNTNRCLDAGFNYDGSGNQAGYPGSRSAAYDAENRQVSLTDSGTWQYAYDGEGRRVAKSKVGGGQSVVYVYDARGQLAAEYSGTPDGTGCTTCYVTVDHLGSTRLVTGAGGSVMRRYDSVPFGYEISSSWGQRSNVTGYQSADTFNPKFTGKPRDYESTLGLDYFGARYFSGAQGRFTSPDSIYFQKEMLSDPQRFNLYAYVRNNPLRYVDPKGEAIELTGTDEERAKKLAAIQSKLGDAGKYLYDNIYKGKHYVGIYTNGPDGKGPAFASINDATKVLSQIITNKAVATIQFAQEGSQLVSGNGRVLATIGSIDVASGKGPGSTRMQADGAISTTVLAPGLNTGVLPGPMMSNGLPGQTDTGLVLWHELGHVLGLMSGEVGPQTNDRADDLENTVRRLKNPSAPVRMMHDPPPGVR